MISKSLEAFSYAFLSLLIITGTAWCQTPDSSPTITPIIVATQTPTPAPILGNTNSAIAGDFANLELSLLETSYKSAPDAPTRDKILSAGEKIINSYCIKEISPNYKLQYAEPNSDCQKMIEKMLKYDISNPSAICAQKGINSDECTAAYARFDLSQIGVYAQSSKDMEANLANMQDSYGEMENNISYYSQKFEETKDPKEMEEVGKILYANFPKYCTIFRYHVADTSAAPTPTPAAKEKDKNLKPFEDLLQQLNNPASLTTPVSTQSNRYRLVSSGCLSILNHMKKFFPQDPTYHCILYGSYSPQCLRAKKGATTTTKSKESLKAPVISDSLNPF